jgi:hypothetical protein
MDVRGPSTPGAAETMMRGFSRMSGGTVFPCAGRMDMPANGRGIDADLPGQLSFLLGISQEPGVHGFPHPYGVETDK